MDINFNFSGDHLNVYGFLMFVFGGYLTGRLLRNISAFKFIFLILLLAFYSKLFSVVNFHGMALFPFLIFGFIGYFRFATLWNAFFDLIQAIKTPETRQPPGGSNQNNSHNNSQSYSSDEARRQYEEYVRQSQQNNSNRNYSNQQNQYSDQNQSSSNQSYNQQEEEFKKREEELKRQTEQAKREAENARADAKRAREEANNNPHVNLDPTKLSDAYKILGLEPGISKSECKLAYKRLIARYHEDKLKNIHGYFKKQALEEAKIITVAWGTIKNQD